MDNDGQGECRENSKINNQIDTKENKIESSLTKWKDILAILQSIFTIFGIMGALYWFYAQGEGRPRAIISHEITHRQLNEKITWVHVSVKIRNIGKIPVNIEKGNVWMQQIKPIGQEMKKRIECNTNIVQQDTHIVKWPNAYDYIHKLNENLWIEPGETDRKSYEFIIPSDLETIKIYSYFENPQNSWRFWKKLKPIGWDEVTVYDLKLIKGNPEKLQEKNDIK